MFGSLARVHGSARIFRGQVLEPFDQGSRAIGMRNIFDQIPEVATGVCKALCMHWIAHHANDETIKFTDYARQAGEGGAYGGGAIAITQYEYNHAVTGAANHAHAKDQFTDAFLRKRGIRRQMNMKYPTRNLTPGGIKVSSGHTMNMWFGRNLAKKIVGIHSANYWSYKIISLHGRAGGHAVAAFVGADAVFFDPNYGIFYFEKAENFRRWFGEPGGFYWASGYVDELGSDFVIKSYAKSI